MSAVLSGVLAPGARLPSTRRLADVSQRLAPDRLARLSGAGLAGLSRGGRAQRLRDLADRAGRPAARPAATTAPAAGWTGAARFRKRFSIAAPIRKPLDWRRYPYPFLYGQNDMTLFDLAAWRDCTRRALARADFEFMAGDFAAADDMQLVQYISSRTCRARHHRPSGRDPRHPGRAERALDRDPATARRGVPRRLREPLPSRHPRLADAERRAGDGGPGRCRGPAAGAPAQRHRRGLRDAEPPRADRRAHADRAPPAPARDGRAGRLRRGRGRLRVRDELPRAARAGAALARPQRPRALCRQLLQVAVSRPPPRLSRRAAAADPRGAGAQGADAPPPARPPAADRRPTSSRSVTTTP